MILEWFWTINGLIVSSNVSFSTIKKWKQIAQKNLVQKSFNYQINLLTPKEIFHLPKNLLTCKKHLNSQKISQLPKSLSTHKTISTLAQNFSSDLSLDKRNKDRQKWIKQTVFTWRDAFLQVQKNNLFFPSHVDNDDGVPAGNRADIQGYDGGNVIAFHLCCILLIDGTYFASMISPPIFLSFYPCFWLQNKRKFIVSMFSIF